MRINKMSYSSIILAAIFVMSLSQSLFSRPLPGHIADPNVPIEKKSVVACTLIFENDALCPPFVPEERSYQAIAPNEKAIRINWADNKGFIGRTVIPYLKKSKEFQDMLRLRCTARHIRAQILEKNENLDAETKAYLNFEVNSPLILVGESPYGKDAKSGPMLMPIGVEVFDPVENKRIALHTSVITLTDILDFGGNPRFSVKNALTNDTLDFVVGHEVAHEIMADMYGKDFMKINRISSGHGTYDITDLGVAYIEGWAEAFEALYGINNPRLKKKDMEKYLISEFIFERQDPIRQEMVVWLYPYVNERKKEGSLKNGSQMMSTEGVVAGIFYDILTSRTINAPFEKCVKTMVTSKPANFMEFVREYVKLFPEDKNTLYRIILESTRYVVMSKDAGLLYRKYYTSKMEYTKNPQVKDAFTQAQNAYTSFKEDLFKKAMNGTDIFANVGPEMWVAYDMSPIGNFNKDLNTIDFAHMMSMSAYWNEKVIGTVPDALRETNFNYWAPIDTIDLDLPAVRLLKEREKRGFFTGNPIDFMCNFFNLTKAELTEQKVKPYTPKSRENTSANYWSGKDEKKVFWPEDKGPKELKSK